MSNGIKEQIDAMLDIGSGTEAPSTESVATNAPSTESVVTNAPSTNAPSTSAPATQAPGTETPGTKAPATSAPATDAPTTAAPEDDELKRVKEENERLRKQVEDSQRKVTPKTKAPTTAPPVEEIDFLGEGVDLDELTRDAKTFNALLNKVHKMNVESSRKFQETTLRNIPDIVKSNVAIQATLKKKVEDFYDTNKDLKSFKKVVSAVYEELAAENPDWNVDKIFNEVETETRKRLELHKKAASTKAPTTRAPRGPNFPKTKTSRQRQKPKTSALLSEIDEMNKEPQ